MHSASDSQPPSRSSSSSLGQADTGKDSGEQVPVQCRLPADEHRRFAIAAERHGAGSTAGQMRVLIRDWMRSLRDAELEDAA